MVSSREEKWGIEDVAQSILGVQDVHNQLRVTRGEARATEPASLVGDPRKLHS